MYLRSKVPEDMYHILQQFAEIRKLTRLSLVRDFNLFPETEVLLTLERKYGDSLNFEDLNGFPGKARKKKQPDELGSVASQMSLTQNQFGTASGNLTGSDFVKSESRMPHSKQVKIED